MSSRSPASPTSPPPRARTSASIRRCSGGWTSSRWPARFASCRPRSMSSTTSTTPNAPTRACPGGSLRRRHGTPPRSPNHRSSLPGALRGIGAMKPPTLQRATPSSTSPGRRQLHRRVPIRSGLRTTTVRRNGTVRARRTEFLIGRQYAGQTAYVLYHATTLEFFDHQGTYIAEADWPAPGTSYVRAEHLRPNPIARDVPGRGPNCHRCPERRRNRHRCLETWPDRHRCPDTSTVTRVLRQNCHRCPETSHHDADNFRGDAP